MSLARPLAIQAPATTAAAVLRDGRVTVDQLVVPPLGAGETLVAVELATVCGADRAAARSADGPARVLGHEGTGRVIATGQGVAILPGTRVTWAPTVTCGRCDRCRSGLSTACRMSRSLGDQPLDGSWPLSGTFARHLVLPRGAAVAPVPDALCDPVAATAGCATATAMAGLEEAGPLTG
ncbi:MAG: alcohol dehydrogenase catalytic domain-containing protein, partial [Microbacterium sp.]